jgi:hypothetical protein
MIIQSKRYHLLSIGNEMGAEYGANANRVAGALELYCSVDPIGVGTGERAEPPLGGRLGEYLGAGDAEAEGEMGVGVQMSKHR